MFPAESDYTPENNSKIAVQGGFTINWPHRPDGPATVTTTSFPVCGDTIAKMTREKQ